MCNDSNSTCNKCVFDILKTILILQREVGPDERCLETCDRNRLGDTPSSCAYNTRPVTIYTCGCCNERLELPVSRDPSENTTSPIFRIEKLEDNCATFRVLTTEGSGNNVTYSATDSFFTINLSCICILKCLGDAFVDNI